MTTTAPQIDTLALLCPDGPIELRVLHQTSKMEIERFVDSASAWRWVNSHGPAKGIYVVMNPFDASRINGTAVNDAAVMRRRWILIDCDPVRKDATGSPIAEKDINATDAEVGNAHAVAKAIYAYLKAQGWPEPVVCMSGNGWHLLYATDLPNDVLSTQLITALLTHLGHKFTTADVKIDTSVYNASRITKLYGTWARKGPDSPERPHRLSEIKRVPPTLGVVTFSDLVTLAPPASERTDRPSGASRYETPAILGKLHVFHAKKKGDVTYHEVRCPWVEQHSTGDPDRPHGAVFTVGDDGAVGFKCLHDHCKDKGWKDLREHLGISAPSKRSVELESFEDTEEVELEWLWRARFAFGNITLVEGAPDKGKSTLLVWIVARATRGQPFPGEPPDTTREPISVVMLIAEDDPGATVKPRLRAAGADLSRVFWLKATKDEHGQIVPFHLSDDCERLMDKCQHVGARLVVVDPLVTYLGSRKGKTLNTNNDLEVRKSIDPLRQIAKKCDAVVAAIRHYRKGVPMDALEAGGGSVGFGADVRVVTACLPDPRADDEDHYLFAVAKNNLVAKRERPAIGYTIVSWDENPNIGVISWGEVVDMSANEVLSATVEASKEDKGKVAEAVAFLENFLKNGAPVPQKDVVKAGKEMANLSAPAIERAKVKLNIKSEKVGKHWEWRLVLNELTEEEPPF